MPNIDMNQVLQMMGGNPQTFLQNNLQRNPQLAQLQTQLTNMHKSSGMSDRDFAMQYAKKNGIDVNQLQALGNMLGLK